MTAPQPRQDRPVGLGCCPFARRYLGNRICFLFLRVLRCFSSPRALPAKRDDGSLHPSGCPIRRSVDHRLLAAPHRVSPLGTSFIGTSPQGIHQQPCVSLAASSAAHAHSLSTPIPCGIVQRRSVPAEDCSRVCSMRSMLLFIFSERCCVSTIQLLKCFVLALAISAASGPA